MRGRARFALGPRPTHGRATSLGTPNERGRIPSRLRTTSDAAKDAQARHLNDFVSSKFNPFFDSRMLAFNGVRCLALYASGVIISYLSRIGLSGTS